MLTCPACHQSLPEGPTPSSCPHCGASFGPGAWKPHDERAQAKRQPITFAEVFLGVPAVLFGLFYLLMGIRVEGGLFLGIGLVTSASLLFYARKGSGLAALARMMCFFLCISAVFFYMAVAFGGMR